MPDKFDPYREALIMETNTVWPDELDHLDELRKERIAAALHGDPEHASILDYVRMHSGFCRQITVTQEDIDRIGL
jgi:hypothetical protein